MTKLLKLLSKKQVEEIVLFSYAHIERMEKAGRFPKRVRLSLHPRGRCGYVEAEILDWISARIAERDMLPE